MKRPAKHLREVAPNSLGDGLHWWGWLARGPRTRDALPAGVKRYVPTQRDLLWVHPCGGSFVLGWIDLTTGTRHRLVSADPLTVEASVACQRCSDHGWIRKGRWTPA